MTDKPTRYVWINSKHSEGRLGHLFDTATAEPVLDSPNFIYGTTEFGVFVTNALNKDALEVSGTPEDTIDG